MPNKPPPETVVLLHGLCMNSLSMWKIAAHLKRAGYLTHSISYPSRTLPIEKIAAEYLPDKLRRHNTCAAPKLHFVTHSMGSLVLRLLLATPQTRPANLGRVVMLGPPNHGSVAADTAFKNTLLRAIVGINVRRLGTGPESVADKLPPADYEVGIIAGNAKLHPLFSRHLAVPNDGTVTAESTRLEHMTDYLLLPHSHTAMLFQKPVITQIQTFLQTAHFLHPRPRTP